MSLLGSDICVAPSAALVDIANVTARTLTVQESIAYYTACGTAATPLAPAGAFWCAPSGCAQPTARRPAPLRLRVHFCRIL